MKYPNVYHSEINVGNEAKNGQYSFVLEMRLTLPPWFRAVSPLYQ